VGLFYAAIAGAAYAVFEHHQANRLAHLINEMMPAFLALILVFVVYCVFRMAVSAVKELNGVSLAAQAPCGLR
jgi:branched-subunit amino acid transport protein AzlD